ncbi:MAG: SF1B family DNA helicase RecD2 [Caulobacteraceae bacterium]
MKARPQIASAPTEVLAAMVERVTFHSADTGFCVLRLKARGHRDLITATGHAAVINAGEFVQLSGTWVNDRTHGLQFKAAFLKASPPTTLAGIERYLGSGMIRGIGPVFAKALVRAFGEQVFEIIETQPDRLREVAGVGPVRAKRIIAGWADQKVIREIMLFLHSNGVGASRAVRIYKTYGAEAVQVISENPYRLAQDIRGIGFRTADQIASKLGIEKEAMIRVRAGISFALSEAMGQGHCGLPVDQLTMLTIKLLEISPDLIAEALRLELASETVIADELDGERCIFLSSLHHAERTIAARLLAISQGATPWREISADRAIPWAEQKTGRTLAKSQGAAVRQALNSKLLVITGGPGVGKTTLVNTILKILGARQVSVLLCAPTGRAAKRLSESTGLQAKTIHRLLETDPKTGGFRRDQANPLDCELLVIDEASMIDVPLMRALMNAVPDGAAILVVGDVDQLPSVGPGQVLADMIASGVLPVVRLIEVFRQAAGSRIVTNAHRINQGLMPELGGKERSDFYFVDAPDPEMALKTLVTVVRHRIPQAFGMDPIRDVQVLCPMNRGSLGARSINIELQQALNPPGDHRVERVGWTFAPGDKVMQVENDYDREVYNGDLGLVRRVDLDEGQLVAEFDGRAVTYSFGELDELVLAYATTIHKSQGSEYPVVVIPLTTQHYTMLARNLLYTSVTRGKQLVVLVGQRKALAIAVKNGAARPRYSMLRTRLESAFVPAITETYARPT